MSRTPPPRSRACPGAPPSGARHELYALEGEGSQLVSRRLVSTTGTLVTPPWSSETQLYRPVRTGSPATGTVSLKQGELPVGTVVDVAGCF